MSSIDIFVGSVYGNAQHAAEHLATTLKNQGIDANLFLDANQADIQKADSILIVTSTTGQGDVPPNIELLYNQLLDNKPNLTQKQFAVAALGDSSYYDSFCGAGHAFYDLLRELGASPLTKVFEIDALETLTPEDSLTQWFTQLITKRQ